MTASKDTGIVNIHGKQYSTVAKRVQDFRGDLGTTFSITTELISADDQVVIMKASISDTEGRVIATGHAEESRTSSQINRTSALENAETSAIGRALAAFGLAGTEFASADEVANAIHQQQTPAQAGQQYSRPAGPQGTGKFATEGQVKLLMKMASEACGSDDKETVVSWFIDQVGSAPNKVLMDDMNAVMEQIRLAKQDA